MRHLAVLLTLLVLPAAATAATTTTDTTPPVVKITGLPAAGSCASKSTRIAFSVNDPSGVRNVSVYVDYALAGKAEGTAALKLSFPHKLKTGRHRLGVMARDNAGNLAHKVVYFRVCA